MNPGIGILAQVAMATNKEERLAVLRQYQQKMQREYMRRWFWNLSPQQQAEELARRKEEQRARQRQS
jgi:hypothetical protein